jgi:hypothetical protein
MHAPFILNIKNSEEVATVEDAVSFAQVWLDSEGFVSSGFFGGGKCDWYEIGGQFIEALEGLKALKFDGEQNLITLCNEYKEDFEYVDSNYDVVVNLEKGDWLVIVDYHS